MNQRGPVDGDQPANDPSLSDLEHGILDALPAHVALVNEEGVILVVNAAWTRFARANSLMPEEAGPGSNYLEVCDRASGEGAREAAAAAIGLRGVLRGELPIFTLEYSCHSPLQQRWFRLMVTPIGSAPPRRAVVMHVDVTERRLAEQALRQSELHYRILFEANPQPMWVFDLETLDFLAVNDAAIAKYGYTRDQFLGMSLRDIRPADDLAAFDAHMEQFQDQTSPPSVWRHRLADGSLIFVEILSDPVEFAGRAARLVMATDVTERLGAEAALRQSEADQRRLVEQLERERRRLVAAQSVAHVGSWETDLATLAVSWSEETYRIFGADPETFTPTHHRFLELVHPDDRDAVDRAFQDSFATRDLQVIEHRIRRPDGQVRYVEERWFTIANDTGEPVRAQGTAQDLTERRRAEEQLAEQAALLEAASEAILVKDLDDRIVFWNRGAERTYGWSADEAVGHTPAELLGEEASQSEPAASALREHGSWQGALRHRARDGAPLEVESSWTLLRHPEGAPKAVLMFNVDVTERRKLEAMLLRAQRLESLGTLAGGIAHDLNNVLAPILMAIELLREGEAEAERLDLLATVASSAERGADMVRQVLSFARGMPGTRMTLDLRSVGRDVGRILRDTLPKNIDIELHFADTLWPIAADATQMHQVLMNLCVNARDAMPSGGKLTITLDNVLVDEEYADVNPSTSPGPHVLMEVVDTGTGILPEHQLRLFEPFFTTKEVGSGSGSGSGLGLPTVHTIVRGHGGFITVYSEVGKGAKFRVYLPAIANSAGPENADADRRDLPRGRGETVLVVDDEPNVREIVRRILERFGYQVHQAANGAEAVALYAQLRSEIAVVLTDMSMPVMDGPATILALRALDPDVRIIGTSGLAANGQAAKAIDAGVRHFVPKPYTVETLLRVLRVALGDVESD